METREQYPITLVTAYFELGGKPEYPGLGNPYPRWIRNFLPFVRWPLVIFCDEQSLNMLKEARGNRPAVWHVTRPEEFYAYRYLDDLKRLSFPEEHAETCIARSLVWHEKHHFLRQALSENPFASEMFFWCDIGQFRCGPDEPLWPLKAAPWTLWSFVRSFRLYEEIEWPNLGACRALAQDKVVMSIGVPWDRNDNPAAVNGSFFGGAIEPSLRWCDAYYRHIEKRKQNGSFTPREELVMRGCCRRWPELVHMMPYGFYPFRRNSGPDYRWHFLKGRRFPWKYIQLSYNWYFLKGGRFPWKYFCRMICPGWCNNARRR